MTQIRSALDPFAVSLAEFVLKWRVWVILACLLATVGIATQAANLTIANNYRVFFSDENPELKAFEEFQATYTKNDNILFVVTPKNGQVFDNDTLSAVREITEDAWQIPHTIRVDSITNFQHTYAIEDDLIVEDLISDPASLSAEELVSKQEIALAEPLLRDQLLTRDASVTAVTAVLQYPEKSLQEVPDSVVKAREIRERVQAAYPNLTINIGGVAMLNNAFSEAGLADMATLTPLMYLVVLVAAYVALRSIAAVFGILMVITTSVMVGMGFAGANFIEMTPISFSAPTVIMTLAVADSIHLLISMRAAMRDGMNKRDALIEAMRVNFLAISITSLTTIVGFLALNFSDAPPFWHLGNITAVGIFAAWIFSLTLLPAIISLLPFNVKVRTADSGRSMMLRLADFVIEKRKSMLAVSLGASALLIAMIPTLDFNDEWVKYFDERIEFRVESDIITKSFGLYAVEYSMPSGQSGGVSEPDFLNKLEDFTIWLREQDHVTHVYSLADIMKRLNKNMHGDDESYFTIPDDRELSAQYLLLYELSLPFGLDLNDRINLDKSETRLTVTLGDATTEQTKEFLNNASAYINANFPPEQRTQATSAQVMFTFITDRNVQNMILGTIIAIVSISLIMILCLRSVSLGLLSLIPNGLPILTTFGLWALLVGQVGFSVATVASISLGIIVDDTVHFLTKYTRARRESGLSVEDAIRYAFDTVGLALIVNTVILVLGFAVLTFSSFKLNVDMGMMTLIAIILALLLDFFLLPALLLLGKSSEASETSEKPAAQPAE